MNTESIAGLIRLKDLFPNEFNYLGEIFNHDISVLKLVHLPADKTGGANCSTMIQEAIRSSIRELFTKKFGLSLGYYDKKDNSICLNACLNKNKVSDELNRLLNIDIKPDQIYIWILFHEIGHSKGFDESGADGFACKKFEEWQKGAF